MTDTGTIDDCRWRRRWRCWYLPIVSVVDGGGGGAADAGLRYSLIGVADVRRQ